MAGTGGFLKQGTGAILLNGASPFSGGAVVREGALVVGDSDHRDAAFSGCGGVVVMPGTVTGGYGSISLRCGESGGRPAALRCRARARRACRG